MMKKKWIIAKVMAENNELRARLEEEQKLFIEIMQGATSTLQAITNMAMEAAKEAEDYANTLIKIERYAAKKVKHLTIQNEAYDALLRWDGEWCADTEADVYSEQP